MQYRRFSKRLRWRITDYYENRYQGKMFNEKLVLGELNPLLRRIVQNYNCRHLVRTVPFFNEISDDVIDALLEKESGEIL